MAKQIKSREDYQALLCAPIAWDEASLFRPDDWIMYIGIRADALTRVKLGTRFRTYSAPVTGISKHYSLVLFEVGAYFDPIRKKSNRVYFELAKMSFAENIWGKQLCS